MSEALSPKFVSVVTPLWQMDAGPEAPVEIGFEDSAAVFYLERGHPCFSKWLAMLKKSAAHASTIVFSHTAVGTFIRSVETGNDITGVVEEIFPEIEKTFVGFTLPGYANIFLIPKNHPRLREWLVLVEKSRSARRKIVFSYDAYNRSVTSLALAEE